MLKPDNRLLFLVFAAALLTVIWSCSQPDDITATKTLTNMWLSAERLPSPPEGSAYELWVSSSTVTDTAVLTSDLISLGKFSFIHNDTIYAFLDTNGQVRADSNKFVFEGDLFDFATLFVSVEACPDPDPSRPGPIMLIEPVTGTSDTITLNFPLDELLGEATCRYNMEAVTDNNRDQYNGYGVWFSIYGNIQVDIQDTLDTSSTTIRLDTIGPVRDTLDDTLFIDTNDDGIIDDTITDTIVFVEHTDSIHFVLDTLLTRFGRDTLALEVSEVDSFRHIQFRLVSYKSIDSGFQDGDSLLFTNLVPADVVYDTTSRVYGLDFFSQDNYWAFPDYSDWGWVYQGWVVSAYIDPAAIGRFTPPGFKYKNDLNNFIPGDTGGLLSTGIFSRIDQPDNSNPFTYMTDLYFVNDGGQADTIFRRPRLPGEDFLDGAALAVATNGVYSAPIDLLPVANGSTYGTVFISLEPDGWQNDSTNFPLLYFFQEFVDYWSPAPIDTTGALATYQKDMLNRTGTTPFGGSTIGFPEVTVTIRRL